MSRLTLALAAALTLALACTASAAPRWQDGPMKFEIQNINCSSITFGPMRLESEVGVSVGQFVDDASPVVGEVFDVRIVVGTVGFNCSGTRPQIEIALPPGVAPAVGGQHTIRCFLQAPGAPEPAPVRVALIRRGRG